MTESVPAARGAGVSGNPILDRGFRPRFHEIRPQHVAPGIRQLLEEARAGVEKIASDPNSPTWATVLGPLDELTERVRQATVPVQHLLAVAESDELRQAWAEVLPEMTRFWSWLHLHPELWKKLKALAESAEAGELDALRARHLERTLKDFRRAGADLDPAGRARLEEIDVELAQLQQTFSENVLDATQRYSLTIKDEERLEGVPADALARFRKAAEAAGEVGWRLTVDQPSFEAVMKHAEDRSLRAELHHAYFTRGMEEPGDNRPLIGRILKLRREKARLLGYSDYPDYRLEEQMVGTGARARDFVAEVTERTRPYWRRDFEKLAAFADEVGIRPLEPWDVAFLVERIRREKFDLDEEALRPYFPLPAVLDGLFEIARRLFGLRVEPKEVAEVWDAEVGYYELFDENGTLLGGFYTDFFPRPVKRQGAWMNDFVYGGPRPDGSFAPHLGLICANVAPAAEGRPALLTHNDVETLFHEFGHLLHHLTSRVPIAGRGGINVAWDWVELPSQLLENWTWERAALDLFARHWETREPLPDATLDRMLAARKLMGGWRQMRQLSFGTLDLALHTRYDPDTHGDPVAWVSDLLEAFTPSRRFAESHPLPSFMHIFSGGYAASYYSYLWSEVLEADLFSRFREAGIFDRETGREYLETILSAGDRAEPDLLFRTFMGRDPDPEALILRNLGEPVVT